MKYILGTLLIVGLVIGIIYTFSYNQRTNKQQVSSTCTLNLATVKELHYITPGMNNTVTSFYIGIRTNAQSSQLFTINKELQCKSLKVVYAISTPGEDGFYTPSITPTFKYIWALKHEGSDDYLLLDMNGNIISKGVVKANPEIANDYWDAENVTKLAEDQGGNDDYIHLLLSKFYGKKDAIVQINMRDGKIVKGTLREL